MAVVQWFLALFMRRAVKVVAPAKEDNAAVKKALSFHGYPTFRKDQ